LHAHAVEGVRLELKVDAYPVSVNVAMPAGLVVNELLTNALKHAFVGRPGGTITLESVSDGNGCRVTVADNGVGLPPDFDIAKSDSLGLQLVDTLVKQLGGTTGVIKENGTKYVFKFKEIKYKERMK